MSAPSSSPADVRLAQLSPWLLAMAGVTLAFVSWRGEAPPPAPATTTVLLGTDGEGTVGVRAPHIVVNGIAVLEVVPDVVDLTIVIAVERTSPAAAVAGMRGQETAMTAALSEAGISGIDLRTSQLAVSPTYTDYPHRRVKGYVAELTLVATLSDFDGMGEVLEEVSGFEVRDLHTRFRSTQMVAKKQELRDMALTAARDKARRSAEIMGVGLGPVLVIEESNRTDTPRWGALGNMAANEYAAAPTEAEGVVPGAIRLSLSVEVEFALAGGATGGNTPER